MPRKLYEPYHYNDPDFAYTYPGSSVLRNKLNIQEPELAREKEYQFTAERIVDLSLKPIPVRSMKDVMAIRHFIFQDMYKNLSSNSDIMYQCRESQEVNNASAIMGSIG